MDEDLTRPPATPPTPRMCSIASATRPLGRRLSSALHRATTLTHASIPIDQFANVSFLDAVDDVERLYRESVARHPGEGSHGPGELAARASTTRRR